MYVYITAISFHRFNVFLFSKNAFRSNCITVHLISITHLNLVGTRYRILACLNIDNGLEVKLSFCDLTHITLAEACELPCPIDCKQTEPSQWGSCKADCGMDAIKTRERTILIEGNEFGRPCLMSRLEVSDVIVFISIKIYDHCP